MTYKVLYIDDGESSAISAFGDALQDTGILDVSVEQPLRFEEAIRHLKKITDDYDAILLDYRLNDFAIDEETTIVYDAPTIAQDIRSKVIKTQIKALPIILISSDQIIENFFDKDITSQDLFDLFYSKNKLVNQAKSIAQEIKSVIEAYRTVHLEPSIQNVLGVQDTTQLDDRITYTYKSIENKNVVYGIVNFVLREMIEIPGPLINEKYLAARLGIDIEKSVDWKEILKSVEDQVKYNGILSKAYPRWWSILLEEWWKGLSKESISLRSSSSEERVSFLKKTLKLQNLVPAMPLKYATSSTFWTVCAVKKKPLDTIDGLKLFSKDAHLWQEQKYVSILGALESAEVRKQFLTTEKERFQLIRRRVNDQ